MELDKAHVVGNGQRNTGAGEKPRRVIKRYSNRKLYDTKDSRYVTLQQIGEMVRAGEEVQIIDNATKEDKTEVTLALIISEELKIAAAQRPARHAARPDPGARRALLDAAPRGANRPADPGQPELRGRGSRRQQPERGAGPAPPAAGCADAGREAEGAPQRDLESSKHTLDSGSTRSTSDRRDPARRRTSASSRPR